MQFLGLASVVAVLTIAGVSAASTLRNTHETTSEGNVAPETTPAPTTKTPITPVAQAPVVQQQSVPAPVRDTAVPKTEPAPVVARPATRAGFVLVEGRTQLTDSITATRTGDSVVVNFDAYGFRTRRSDKLENTLRTTLPLVFGKTATASVDTMSAGSLVTEHDVVGDLAKNGMRVKLDNGAIAHIRVLTRSVSDGPIAIGYLAIIER